MTTTDALYLYRELADQHGLEDWRVVLDTKTTIRAGVCNYRKKTLGLSKWFIEQAPGAEVTNTILHEIAHALVGPGHGHGPVWKAKARAIGCTGDRCHKVENKNRSFRYRAACPCGIIHTRNRLKPGGQYRCVKTKTLLKWEAT